MNKFWVFDIETYKNFFITTFKSIDSLEIHKFVVYKDTNNINELINFVYGYKDKYFIGYNNTYFDDKILSYIHKVFTDLDYIFGYTNYTNNEICQMIYDFAMKIINKEEVNYNTTTTFNSIDLIKVVSGINKSLKLVAVNLKWPLIQELPVKVDKEVTDIDVDTIIHYNLNDVEITERLYHHLEPQLKLRGEISKLYDVNVISESKSGIANRILEKVYHQLTGIPIKDFKKLRTDRNIIHFKNVIFDTIVFKSKQLQDLLAEIKQYNWYKNQKFFSKSIILNEVKYKLGIGGIHSDDKGNIFESDENNYLIDCDINSMYPTIIINNNLCPVHLDNRFVVEYKNIMERRLKAKKSKNKVVEADTLKIVLNSVFGKTLNEHHWLYDPLVGLKITLNGQLYILMLIEDLNRSGFKVISANTDGLITIVPKDKLDEYYSICNKWCEYTKFELDYMKIKRYIRKDVNNYIIIKEDGSLKEKGDFVVDTDDLAKGFEKPIISIALREYFLNGVPYTDTIYNHRDIYDFCIAQRTDPKFTNELHTLESSEKVVKEFQRANRWYISTNGGTFYKVDKKENKYINYCANRKVTIFNEYIKYDNFEDYKIDYGYYISEVQKIINLIQDQQLKLF